jgi:hypothetical protein
MLFALAAILTGLISMGMAIGAIWTTGMNSPLGKTAAVMFAAAVVAFICSSHVAPKGHVAPKREEDSDAQ